MKLIPQSLINRIPKLYDTEQEEDPMVWVKLFFPDFHWTWYVIEYDGDDLCFGWVDGNFPELGYFRLSELRSARGKLGLPIERERYFKPCRLSQVQAQHSAERVEKKGIDDWRCVCGNTPLGEGFYPSDEAGIEVEPTPETWNGRYYVCADCGRIIDQFTLVVVGWRTK